MRMSNCLILPIKKKYGFTGKAGGIPLSKADIAAGVADSLAIIYFNCFFQRRPWSIDAC